MAQAPSGTPASRPDAPHPFPRIRAGISPLAPFSWISRGLSDLHHAPGPSLFYGLCISAMGILLMSAVRTAIELATAAATGFMLVGPFLALGLYDLSRRRERGLPCTLGPTLDAWRINAGAIGIFSLILIVLYLLWARASMIAFALFYTGGLPSAGTFMHELAHAENLDFVIAYCAVGGFFATLVFAASVVSLPLMLDRGEDTVTAVLASLIALARNGPAMAVWALLIVVLVLIGIGTAFVGLIVTLPIVGHATWHAYRDLVEPA